jgi:selenide,water dikinase
LLVGFEHKDDAGIFRLDDTHALVQTLDFFTPVVDDPYAYGQIAAANALSDVYAMGGVPMTAMNIACFDPQSAPAEVWAAVLQGAYDKCAEAGVSVVGGHSVEDPQPKFGLSVTGLVDPSKMFVNTSALPGQKVFLTKPLGTGIVTTAAKNDLASEHEIGSAIQSMSQLNADAARKALDAGVRCATDVTGFGLAGHLFNVARASNLGFEICAEALPLLPGVERLIALGQTTGGADRNRQFLGEAFTAGADIPGWLVDIVFDPQTSGGLLLVGESAPGVEIGRSVAGPQAIRLI